MGDRTPWALPTVYLPHYLLGCKQGEDVDLGKCPSLDVDSTL